MNKGRPGGKSGAMKSGSRARGKMLPATPPSQKRESLGRKRALSVRPAGRGGPGQWAGGPDHHGADASEDRNP
jgi:hypothetical protein